MKSTRPFHFKQFTIRQEKAAMKVGTDGVLLGSWVSITERGRMLDIGTGTGLIALMLAQRSSLPIDALEPDQDAFEEAKSNIAASPWPHQVQVINQSLQEWTSEAPKYITIVCNPPFFRQSLLSGSTSKNRARHQLDLSLNALISHSKSILETSGHLSFIYPADMLSEIKEALDQYQMYLSRITFVKPTPDKAPKRVLIEASKAPSTEESSELVVETSRHQYSVEFKKLAGDFYLKL